MNGTSYGVSKYTVKGKKIKFKKLSSEVIARRRNLLFSKSVVFNLATLKGSAMDTSLESDEVF